jgi:FkbM family methyltransferase
MYIKTENLAAVKKFIDCPQQRYLFGATPYAAEIAKAIPVQAVIDDHFQQPSFQGVPVIRTKDAPQDAVVVTTTLGRPLTARRKLLEANLLSCDYFVFSNYSGLRLPEARFWSGFGQDARNHRTELDFVRKNLADAISIDTFDRIINFRLSADLDQISIFKERQEEQYFEGFLQLKSVGEVFCDIGGFDGQTTLDFIARCPEFKTAHVFEPDHNNFLKIQKIFENQKKVRLFNVGLGSEKGTARFSSSGSTSSILSDGDFEVHIEKLDSFHIDDLTFLKMDIEGAELGALDGASDTIARCRPRLAICVYHNPSDMWQIPQKILSIHSGYDLYLRHYTEGVTETVMFFIPKK